MLLSCSNLAVRKDIPSQEIIPLDRGIAVVNSGPAYLTDKLSVSLRSDDGLSKKMSYDSNGFCLFSGLSNGKTYTVVIGRTDLKGMLLYKKLTLKVQPRELKAKYYVLVGASIGKAWEFEQAPYRLKLGSEVIFGNRTKYDFDKTEEIERLTRLPVPISGVILKECAAFFPRDLDASKRLVKKWVGMLRSHDITPILATIVPVTKERDLKEPKKLEAVLAYNDFIREYAANEKIAVLDLEEAARITETDRHLRDDFAAPDGLHLVRKAYLEGLDKAVLRVIGAQ